MFIICIDNLKSKNNFINICIQTLFLLSHCIHVLGLEIDSKMSSFLDSAVVSRHYLGILPSLYLPEHTLLSLLYRS